MISKFIRFIIGFILDSGKDDVENKYLHGKYIAT